MEYTASIPSTSPVEVPQSAHRYLNTRQTLCSKYWVRHSTSEYVKSRIPNAHPTTISHSTPWSTEYCYFSTHSSTAVLYSIRTAVLVLILFSPMDKQNALPLRHHAQQTAVLVLSMYPNTLLTMINIFQHGIRPTNTTHRRPLIPSEIPRKI